MEPGQTPHNELSNDLKASVAARRELGPELEDQVLEAFLARVQTQIDTRVAQQVAGSGPVTPPTRAAASKYNPTEIVGATFGIAIPLVLFAGIFGGWIAIAMIMLAVIAVNVLYVLHDRL